MWNPDLYLKFADERTRPARDLAAAIPQSAPARILDLGCGPGNSTQVLRERWPGARITGLDSSPEMIAKARATYPDGDWRVADLAGLDEPPCDLLFANAVLQWLPDHDTLLPRLLARVAPGGHLAAQMPTNPRTPLRRAIVDAARHPRFSGRLTGAGGGLTFLDAPFYQDLLAPLAANLDLWVTTYYHLLASHQGIVDWFSSTALRPFLERLPDPADQDFFKAEVRTACERAYPLTADGRVLMPFERLFLVARAR